MDDSTKPAPGQAALEPPAADQRAPSRYPPSPFPLGWFQVAYGPELAPGDVRPLRYLGQDFVLWRDLNGGAHVFDAHCSHLGAHLGYGGVVDGEGIRCGFHAWKYDDCGRCVDIPYSKGSGLERGKGRRIKSHPIVERNGFIMLWWHPEGAAPAWEVPEIAEYEDPQWTDYYRHEWRIDTHWQEMVENAVDTSHFHYLHKAAAVPEIVDFEIDGPIMRTNAKHVFVTPLGQHEGFIDTIMYGPTFGTVRFSIGDLVEILFTQGLTPVSENELHACFSFMTRGKGARATLGRKLADEVIRQIDADAPIWEHKVYHPRPRLADGDGPIMRFRRWAQQFYTDHHRDCAACGSRI